MASSGNSSRPKVSRSPTTRLTHKGPAHTPEPPDDHYHKSQQQNLEVGPGIGFSQQRLLDDAAQGGEKGPQREDRGEEFGRIDPQPAHYLIVHPARMAPPAWSCSSTSQSTSAITTPVTMTKS